MGMKKKQEEKQRKVIGRVLIRSFRGKQAFNKKFGAAES